MKQTQYSELRNTLLVISFNQPIDEPDKIQPVVIEARTEAVTPEGAVRNVTNKVNIGEITNTKLTNEELYKTVYGISEVLAEALKGVLMDAVEEDMSTVDTKSITAVGIADITRSDIKPL